MEVKLEGDFYFFSCPNCNGDIIVQKNELNCKIFRHGILKNNFKQVDPHLSFEKCKKLLENDEVIGCCKPFRIIRSNNTFIATICDYI